MYFTSEFEVVLKSDLLINERVNRVGLLNSIDVFPVVVGDIIAFHFEKPLLFINLKVFVLLLRKNHC